MIGRHTRLARVPSRRTTLNGRTPRTLRDSRRDPHDWLTASVRPGLLPAALRMIRRILL